MTVTTTEKTQEILVFKNFDANTDEILFTFPILDESDLFVQSKTSRSPDVIEDLKLGIHYTVTGTGNTPGKTDYKEGKIKLIHSKKGGWDITTTFFISRITPKTQEVNYTEYGKTPAETKEEALDKLTMITQELNNDSKQFLKMSPAENIGTQITNISGSDFLKVASDGSGFIGEKIQTSSGIQSIYEDKNPTLSKTLNTNGNDIRLYNNHGLVDTSNNPTFTIQHNGNSSTNLNIDVTQNDSVSIGSQGQNENIDVTLHAKGTGKVILNSQLYANQSITVEGVIQSPTDTDLILHANGSGNTIIDNINISEKFNNIETTATNAETKTDTATSKINNLEITVNNLSSDNDKSLWKLKAQSHGFYYELDTNNNLILDHVIVKFTAWCVYDPNNQNFLLDIKHKSDTAEILDLSFTQNATVPDYKIIYVNLITPNEYLDNMFNDTSNSYIEYNFDMNQPGDIENHFENKMIKIKGTISPDAFGNIDWFGNVNLHLNNNDPTPNFRWPKLETKIGPMPT